MVQTSDTTPEFGSKYFNDESNTYKQRTDTLTDTEDTAQHNIHHTLNDALDEQYIVGRSYWSPYNAVEYIVGNNSIIINIPHGGHKLIDNIRIRTKSDGCIVHDYHTQSLGRYVAKSIKQLSNTQPHVVILHAHRKCIDGNRSRKSCHSDAGDTAADTVWQYIHTYINISKQQILNQYKHGLFIDLHGQSFDTRSQLGYMLNKTYFDTMTVEQLNNADTSRASIQSLFNKHNTKLNQTLTPNDVLRGEYSFGGICEKYGLSCVPSNINPTLNELNYFSGAYNTLAHGTSAELQNIRKQCCSNSLKQCCSNSVHNNNTDTTTQSILLPFEHRTDICTQKQYQTAIIAIQVESAFVGVRDTAENRMSWANRFAQAVLEFVDVHLIE